MPVRTAPVRAPAPAPVRAPTGYSTGGRSRVAPARRRLLASAATGPSSARERWLPPGWPLKYLLVGFPLWWVLGLNTLIFPIMAVPMAAQLLRRRDLRLPAGMLLWVLFLVWQVIGIVLLNESPPTTHAGSLSGRLISLVFTLVEYGGVTVTLLYVVNLSTDRVSNFAIARWMGWFFVTVFFGGLLGLAAPKLTFRSAIEYVLPHSVAANGFVKALVHPVAAQVQDVIGSGNGRPAAPFGYTNSWGNALSILVVWFVAAWLVPARGRRRLLCVAVLAVTIVPVILSLNRGLWVGVAVTILWLLARLFTQARIGAVLAAVALAALGAIVLVLSPLNSVVSARLTHGVSDNIRTFVAQKSIIAVEHSPVVGYGGNRHANGSSASITVGPSPDCAQCGDVPTGSTGQLWQVMFNQGLPGVVFYFGFFLYSLWIYRRERRSINEAALVTIVLTFVYMFFYSALPVAPTLTMIAVAVLWRARESRLAPLRRLTASAPEPA